MFDDSDEVAADVEFIHSGPKRSVPDPVKRFLKVYENMVEILLVLELFLTQDSQIEDLFGGTPACPKTSLLFTNDVLRLWLQSIQ